MFQMILRIFQSHTNLPSTSTSRLQFLWLRKTGEFNLRFSYNLIEKHLHRYTNYQMINESIRFDSGISVSEIVLLFENFTFMHASR